MSAYVGELMSNSLGKVRVPVQTIIIIVYLYFVSYLLVVICGIDYFNYIVFCCPADGSLLQYTVCLFRYVLRYLQD